jgi:hypothetical protein
VAECASCQADGQVRSLKGKEQMKFGTVVEVTRGGIGPPGIPGSHRTVRGVLIGALGKHTRWVRLVEDDPLDTVGWSKAGQVGVWPPSALTVAPNLGWRVGDRCYCWGEAQTRFTIETIDEDLDPDLSRAWLITPKRRDHGWESLKKLHWGCCFRKPLFRSSFP